MGWSSMPHDLKMELKGRRNHSFPMAFLEAKRHVHDGMVRIPYVTDSSDDPKQQTRSFWFGRPNNWPEGLAGRVLRNEARVDVMTLSVSDDNGSGGLQLRQLRSSGAPGASPFRGVDDSSRPCFIGVATKSLQGGCSYQEDRFVSFQELTDVPDLKIAPGLSFFGVYDGHGGHKVAEYLSENLHKNFAAELRRPWASVASALRASFKRTDKELLDHWRGMTKEERKETGHGDDFSSGAAAVVVVMQGQDLVIAHVGDCRVALCSEGKCTDLTVDHTYHNCAERTRVSDMGGLWEAERLDGTLAVSRAFGDFEDNTDEEDNKPRGLISDPDMREVTLGPSDEFMLVSDRCALPFVIWKYHYLRCTDHDHYLRCTDHGFACRWFTPLCAGI